MISENVHIYAPSYTLVFTRLTWNYTFFDYKPSLFSKHFCGGILISNLCPTWPYMDNLIVCNKSGKTLWLRRKRERLELTVPLYIESSYLYQQSDCLRGRLVAGGGVKAASHFLIAHSLHLHWFMILCPAELRHYELHHKQHETVTDNSAIAVSPYVLHSEKTGI